MIMVVEGIVTKKKNTKPQKAWYIWQGRQGSNLQPTVLETVTLPIALLPYEFTQTVYQMSAKGLLYSTLCCKLMSMVKLKNTLDLLSNFVLSY